MVFFSSMDNHGRIFCDIFWIMSVFWPGCGQKTVFGQPLRNTLILIATCEAAADDQPTRPTPAAHVGAVTAAPPPPSHKQTNYPAPPDVHTAAGPPSHPSRSPRPLQLGAAAGAAGSPSSRSGPSSPAGASAAVLPSLAFPSSPSSTGRRHSPAHLPTSLPRPPHVPACDGAAATACTSLPRPPLVPVGKGASLACTGCRTRLHFPPLPSPRPSRKGDGLTRRLHPALPSSSGRGGIVCLWGRWTRRLWRANPSAGHHRVVSVGRHRLRPTSTRHTPVVPLGGRRPAGVDDDRARPRRAPRLTTASSTASSLSVAIGCGRRRRPRRAPRSTTGSSPSVAIGCGRRGRPRRALQWTATSSTSVAIDCGRRARPRRAPRSTTTSSPSVAIGCGGRAHAPASCPSVEAGLRLRRPGTPASCPSVDHHVVPVGLH